MTATIEVPAPTAWMVDGMVLIRVHERARYHVHHAIRMCAHDDLAQVAESLDDTDVRDFNGPTVSASSANLVHWMTAAATLAADDQAEGSIGSSLIRLPPPLADRLLDMGARMAEESEVDTAYRKASRLLWWHGLEDALTAAEVPS